MAHIQTVYKYLAVIALGFIVFLIDYWELTNPVFSEMLLFGVSVAKSAYFIAFTFRSIRDSAQRDFYFHEFLPFVVLTVALFVLSFGLDYYCLYRIRPTAFSGDLDAANPLQTLVTFLYFSVTTFTTAGLGDIVPHAVVARVFVMMELFVAFFFTILVIANITHLRESFSKKSERPR